MSLIKLKLLLVLFRQRSEKLGKVFYHLVTLEWHMSNKIFMYEFKCDQMTNIFKIWLFMYSNEKLPNRIKSLPNTNYTLRKITK